MGKSSFDRFADWLAWNIGSNASLAIHTVFFSGFFALYLMGVSFDRLILVLTLLVSLEAIYLSVIIQRSVNKQERKIEHIMAEIRENTVIHLHDPMDKVVGDIYDRVKVIEKDVEAEKRAKRAKKR